MDLLPRKHSKFDKFWVRKKKLKKTTFFDAPPITKDFVKKPVFWTFHHRHCHFLGVQKLGVPRGYPIDFIKKWPFFQVFVSMSRRWSKNDPKIGPHSNSDQDLWYQDFFWYQDSLVPEKISKSIFCPSSL